MSSRKVWLLVTIDPKSGQTPSLHKILSGTSLHPWSSDLWSAIPCYWEAPAGPGPLSTSEKWGAAQTYVCLGPNFVTEGIWIRIIRLCPLLFNRKLALEEKLLLVTNHPFDSDGRCTETINPVVDCPSMKRLLHDIQKRPNSKTTGQDWTLFGLISKAGYCGSIWCRLLGRCLFSSSHAPWL